MREADQWRRAYEIFDQALEHAQEDREAFAHREASGEPGVLPIVLELIRNASEEVPGGLDDPYPPGRRLGRYEITGILGRGGMGRVYAARDTELGRVVALKVMAAGGTSEQLVREAKAASALNHPNIVTVHDVVREGPDIAIAMELVEGNSLRSQCGRARPVAAVIHWGRQMALALAATHARGIVHRDIKPENVIVRPDGYIKVLDFGLARRERLPGASSTASSLFGKLGGTLNYMSPEQTRGETPAAASDIFSLGVVLYELACGRHPFPSASPIDTAYAIAHHRPTLSPDLPEDFNNLLEAMLEKSAPDRPSAAQVAERLASLEDAEDQPGEQAKTRWPVFALLGGLLLGVAWGLFSWWPGSRPASGPVLRYSIPVETAAGGSGPLVPHVAISPQGDQIAYQVGTRLYRQTLLGGGRYSKPAVIPGSEGGRNPFYSPDGREVAFFLKDSIRVASATAFRDLGVTPPLARWHGSWGGNGFVYFNADEGGTPGIWRLPASGGGKPTLVLQSESTARGFGFRMCQQWLEGGLLFSVNFGPLQRSLQWWDEKSGETRRLVERGMGGYVLPDGQLIYYWAGSLFAAPFDLRQHRMTGPAARVGDEVESSGWIGGAYAISQSGTLAYIRRAELPLRQLVWVTPEGRETPLPLSPDAIEQADVSPDGARIAITRLTAERHWVLVLYDVRSNTSATLMETPYEKLRAIWSPDSKSLLVSRTAEGRQFTNLFIVPVQTPDSAERLTDQPDFGQYPMAWSATGDSILFLEGIHPKTESDILSISRSTGRIKTLVASRGPDRSPTVSPDGRWFAYSVDYEDAVFLQDLAQTKAPRKIAEGASNPLWSPKGDRIYYLNRDSGLMEIPVDRVSGAAGSPRQIVPRGFTMPVSDYWTRAYSIAADGRLLAIREAPRAHPQPVEIQVVENWPREWPAVSPRP